MWAWESGAYSAAFKARVLAWHNAHRLIELHSESAVQQAIERRMRRRRG